MTDLDAVLEDRTRGASEIEARLLEVLLGRLDEEVDEGPGELLEELMEGVLEHQPAMANLLGLVNESWLAVEGDAAKERLAALWQRRRRAVAGDGDGLEEVFRRRVGELIETTAAGRGPRRLTVYTFSRSGSVLRVLRRLARQEAGLRVRVGEGRPGGEGVDLVRDLAEGGGPDVRLAPDSVLAAELAGTLPAAVGPALLLLGADALGPQAWLNKVGSSSLVLAARQGGVPVGVVAETTKVVPLTLFRHLQSPPVPSAARQDLAAELPSERLAEPAPLFERLPVEWVEWFITERGVFAPAELAERAAGPVAETLARRLEETAED